MCLHYLIGKCRWCSERMSLIMSRVSTSLRSTAAETNRFENICTCSRSRLHLSFADCALSRLQRTIGCVPVNLLVATGNQLRVVTVLRWQRGISTDTVDDAGEFILQPADQRTWFTVSTLCASCKVTYGSFSANMYSNNKIRPGKCSTFLQMNQINCCNGTVAASHEVVEPFTHSFTPI